MPLAVWLLKVFSLISPPYVPRTGAANVPKEREPYVQNTIPTWQGPIADPETGRWVTSHVMNQDFVTWVGQGRIADRSREHLNPSDRGPG